MDPTILREKIKAKLKERHLTVAEAERQSGIGPSSLRNFLSGRIKSPTLETITALSKTLKCNLADLLGSEENSINSTFNTSDWKPDIFSNTTEYVKNTLENNKITLRNEEALAALKEIYKFSCTKEGNKVDKEFADWYLKNITKTNSF